MQRLISEDTFCFPVPVALPGAAVPGRLRGTAVHGPALPLGHLPQDALVPGAQVARTLPGGGRVGPARLRSVSIRTPARSGSGSRPLPPLRPGAAGTSPSPSPSPGPAQPRGGTGRRVRGRSVPAQSGIRHRAPGWTRPLLPPHSPERGRGRGAAAGPAPPPPPPLTPPSSPPSPGLPTGALRARDTPTRPSAYWVPCLCISSQLLAAIGQWRCPSQG